MDRRLEVADEALQLGRRHQPARLRDPRERGVDRRRRLVDAGQDLARERTQRRERLIQVQQRAVGLLEHVGQNVDAGLKRARLAGEGCHRRVEVRDQPGERVLVAGERRREAGR